MDLLNHLHRSFAYDHWANREALASLRSAGAPPPRALKLLAHILGAEHLWLGRLKRDGKAVVVWPQHSLEECAAQIAELRGLWQEYLEPLTPELLSTPISYVNSKGEPWTNSVADILFHVILHSAYHRGQIARELRAAGHEPAYTDFIHSIRQGFIE